MVLLRANDWYSYTYEVTVNFGSTYRPTFILLVSFLNYGCPQTTPSVGPDRPLSNFAVLLPLLRIVTSLRARVQTSIGLDPQHEVNLS